jgi:hypothetical protein
MVFIVVIAAVVLVARYAFWVHAEALLMVLSRKEGHDE